MNKNDIAKMINASIVGLSRKIRVNEKLDINFDDIIVVDKAESWTDGGVFRTENEKEYEYIFKITNATPCHVVDYSNVDECDILSAEDCEDEKEVLIPSGTKFRVTEEPAEVDFDEMGYYIIELEYIGGGQQ